MVRPKNSHIGSGLLRKRGHSLTRVVIREMQIKTSVRHHFTLTRITIVKQSTKCFNFIDKYPGREFKKNMRILRKEI